MSKQGPKKSPASRVVRDQLDRERKLRRNRWITVGSVALVVVAGLIGFTVYETHKSTPVATPAAATNDGAPNSGLLAGGSGPVTVEVYLDFQCPNCKDFESTVTPTLNQLIAANRIRLVWHPVNILDGSSTTHYSTRAGNSAACAALAPGNKLKAYGEALFANQPPEGGGGLTDDQIIDIAGNAGINTPEFAQCVRNQTYNAWVNQVTNSMFQRGHNGTPTILVNGRQVTIPTAANVQAAVDAA